MPSSERYSRRVDQLSPESSFPESWEEPGGMTPSGNFELSGGPVMAPTTEGAIRITPVSRLIPTAAAE